MCRLHRSQCLSRSRSTLLCCNPLRSRAGPLMQMCIIVSRRAVLCPAHTRSLFSYCWEMIHHLTTVRAIPLCPVQMFECLLCEYRAPRKEELTKHMRKHLATSVGHAAQTSPSQSLNRAVKDHTAPSCEKFRPVKSTKTAARSPLRMPPSVPMSRLALEFGVPPMSGHPSMMMQPVMGDMGPYGGGYPMTGGMGGFVGGFPTMGACVPPHMALAQHQSRWGGGGYPNPSSYYTSAMDYMLVPPDTAKSTMAPHARPVPCSTDPSFPPSSMANHYHFHPGVHHRIL
jgi:hypothetical protein